MDIALLLENQVNAAANKLTFNLDMIDLATWMHAMVISSLDYCNAF